MNNEFILIPLTKENFENTFTSNKTDPRCPLPPSALLKCICDQQMRSAMENNIINAIIDVRNNPDPRFPIGCGDLLRYDLSPGSDCPVCPGKSREYPNTNDNFNLYSLRQLVLAASTREEKDAIIINNINRLPNVGPDMVNYYNKKVKLLIIWGGGEIVTVCDIDNGYGYFIKGGISFFVSTSASITFQELSLDKIPNDIQIKMGINKDGTLLLPPFDENSDWDTNIKVNISKLNIFNQIDLFREILLSYSSNDLKDNFISKMAKLLDSMKPSNITYNKTIRLLTAFKDEQNKMIWDFENDIMVGTDNNFLIAFKSSTNTKLLLNDIPSDLQKKLGILKIDPNNCITFMNPPTDGVSNWDPTKASISCPSTPITAVIPPSKNTNDNVISLPIKDSNLAKSEGIKNLECSANNFNFGSICIPKIIIYIFIGVLVLLIIKKLLKKR